MNEETTRRRFLQWLLGGTLGLTALAAARISERFMQPPLPTSRPSPAKVAAVDAPAEGASLYMPTVRAYLMRDQAGFYAMTAICTHLGCLLDKSADGLVCPCHGSRYNRDGRNLTGPAPAPLNHLAVSWGKSGDLVIDPNIVVSPGERLSAQG